MPVMPAALLAILVVSLGVLASGATVVPTAFGLSLKVVDAFADPKRPVDHDDAVLRGIDAFRTIPAPLQQRADGSGRLSRLQGPLWATEISIGTPVGDSAPQIFTVIIDTGSSDLWVPDVQCKGPCHDRTKKKYCSGHSKTSEKVQGAAYTHVYGAGITVGDGGVYTDVVRIAAASASRFPFSAALNVTVDASRNDYPSSPFDGILGLAFSNISHMPPGYDNPLVPTLFSQGAISRIAFSLRLSADNAVSELFLGGANPTKFAGQFEYHAINQTGYWQVSGGRILVGGQDIVTDQEFIVDSGARSIFGDAALVRVFYATIPGAVEYDPAEGFYAFPCSGRLPKIALSFGTGEREWPFSRETFDLGPIASMPGMCQGAIVGGTGIPNTWILGTPFLQNVYTTFVLEGQPMVGFATPV